MVESSKEVEEKKSSEFGKCSLCWELILNQVMMCPQCSALFCSECHKKLPKTQYNLLQCSNCRQNSKDFARNRPIEQLIAGQILKDRDRCQKHRMEKVYFCKTCNEPSCSSCMIFDGLHAGHEIVNLSELYKEKILNLEEDMTKTRLSRQDFNKRSKEMDERIGLINSSAAENTKNLEQFIAVIKAAQKSKDQARIKSIEECKDLFIKSQLNRIDQIDSTFTKIVS